MNDALKMFKRGRPKTLNLDELIDVAMITYWSEGPANVSINQICNKAKISKPGLYRELGGEDGLMESVLERRMEIIRPNNEQSKNFINKQEIRIERTIKWLENNWKNYNENYLTMDQIAIACSLEYTNFRLNDLWEKNSPYLKKWLNNFRQKDFMKSTIPIEAK